MQAKVTHKTVANDKSSKVESSKAKGEKVKSTKLKVALIQLTSGSKIEQNVENSLKLAEQACTQHSPDLLLFPENFLCFERNGLSTLASSLETYLSTLQKFAVSHSCVLVCGSLPVSSGQEDGRFFSVCHVIDAQGMLVSKYEKIHLFDADVADGVGYYRESDTYCAGSSPKLLEVNGFLGGLSICYDLRFPQLYQYYREKGAEFMCVPSAFTAATGKAHWESLLRARAIETQSYILAANQWGQHGKSRETWGHSMIVDPWGNIVSELKEGEGVCVAMLDFDVVRDIRTRMPIAQHKREF